MIRNHKCQALLRYGHQPLSLMRTTFYNNACMQMQIYVDCLFRLVHWYINLQVHSPLFFALKEIMWLFQSYLSRVLWSGLPIKMTRGAFPGQQPSPPLDVLCWTGQAQSWCDRMGHMLSCWVCGSVMSEAPTRTVTHLLDPAGMSTRPSSTPLEVSLTHRLATLC